MQERRIRTFTVLPRLPERLHGLHKLAYNLWWSWNHEAVFLFRRIDEDLFEALDNSPIRLLNTIDQARIEQLVKDDGFLAHMDRVSNALDQYMNGATWFGETYGVNAPRPDSKQPFQIAYFSAEFGIHESIPEYSGGLGVLAGDHLKSASDLGIPLIGVSLMYRQGYMRQYLNHDGWQQERYPENDFFNLPLISENGPDGKSIFVAVQFPGRQVHARIWRIQVGRVPLYLLDANVPQNSPEDREITAQLYGGDQEMRVRQEMVLGIGGMKALKALGVSPTVCHMNEGHSAFLALERIRMAMEESRLGFDEACELVSAGNVFTTHTPVPAGNDSFPHQLIERYLAPYLPPLRLNNKELLALGREKPNDDNELFCMTVLAIKLANVNNGVSKLHGRVSRKMWHQLWPSVPDAETPIISITNGVHTHSWVSPELAQLHDRYLGTAWFDSPTDHSVWRRIDNIPDAELWRTHERRRERLVAISRQRLKAQLRNRGATPAEINRADEVLDPDALTICFARRFATYKRANLIFRNLERLNQVVNHPEHPVQLIFSGKAHPRDQGGKELIAEVIHVARRPEFRRRIVFLEDYDIHIARYLVQGADIWLNNPRRPLEASGTSGMKAAANGCLNLSILDGWWAEGYTQDNGWSIGAGEEYTDIDYQNEVESRAIYDLLEDEVAPLFYARGSDGLPRGWIKMMKRAMRTICPFFNTNRMLQEYLERCYLPSAQRFSALATGDMHGARAFAQWKRNLKQQWPHVRIEAVEANGAEGLQVGSGLDVRAKVHLGALKPDDVEVQLFHGPLDSHGEIADPRTTSMSANGQPDRGNHLYSGTITCRTSGHRGFAVRVLPKHAELANPLTTGLICWG